LSEAVEREPVVVVVVVEKDEWIRLVNNVCVSAAGKRADLFPDLSRFGCESEEVEAVEFGQEERAEELNKMGVDEVSGDFAVILCRRRSFVNTLDVCANIIKVAVLVFTQPNNRLYTIDTLPYQYQVQTDLCEM
jgi:hypothetical protein